MADQLSTTPNGCARATGPRSARVLEVDGEAAGVRRLPDQGRLGQPRAEERRTVMELIGLDGESEQALWQWVFSIDLVGVVKTWRGPMPHPLQLMVTEPRRLASGVADGMWLRIIELPAALEGRSYRGPGSLVFEVTDDFCPWNAGRWQLTVAARGRRRNGDRHARRAGPGDGHPGRGRGLPRCVPVRRSGRGRPRARVPSGRVRRGRRRCSRRRSAPWNSTMF